METVCQALEQGHAAKAGMASLRTLIAAVSDDLPRLIAALKAPQGRRFQVALLGLNAASESIRPRLVAQRMPACRKAIRDMREALA